MMNVGEALIGDGEEIAHIDLMIGDKIGTGRYGIHKRLESDVRWAHTANCSDKAEFTG